MAITISGDSPNLTSASLTTPTLTSPTFAGTPSGSIITSMTAQASTSGTSIDFTSIPSWVKRVTVMFNGVSTNGTSPILIQVGDSGGIETSGYVSRADRDGASTASTAGFILNDSSSAASTYQGAIVLNNLNAATFTWVANGNLNSTSQNNVMSSAGAKSLSATLDQVRITTVNGTDTFDAGTINILYE
jgi:hypothetical protein